MGICSHRASVDPGVALSDLQFKPPANQTWDYRPGHNDGDVGIVRYPSLNLDVRNWSQRELIGNTATEVATIACAEGPANGGPHSNGEPVADPHDITAGWVGPLAAQVHNSGIQDKYKVCTWSGRYGERRRVPHRRVYASA
jgi:hypothetical protein